MDLDALLGLLFFVVFVVLPMITGVRRRGKGAPGPQQGRGASTPRQPGSGAPATSAQPSQGTAAGARRDDHPASSTLEEIRRRVQDAQERERRREAEQPYARRDSERSAPAPQRAGARGLVSSDPFERGLVSGSGKSVTGERLGMGREGAPVAGQPIGMGGERMGAEGMGREGVSREWPPPAADPLAGRAHTSVLGREGATRASGRPPPTGGAGLGREGLPGSATGGPRRGGLGREGQPAGDLRPRSGALGREGYARPSQVAGRSLLGREGGTTRSERAAAAEIGAGGARPARSDSGARLSRAGLVSTDRDGILHGLIWHEILKEAPGKKLLRRTRSRLP